MNWFIGAALLPLFLIAALFAWASLVRSRFLASHAWLLYLALGGLEIAAYLAALRSGDPPGGLGVVAGFGVVLALIGAGISFFRQTSPDESERQL